MIIEKLTEEEWALYEIMRDPAWFGEFVYNLDTEEGEETWELTDYQYEFLLDYSELVSLSCGRSVGKTEALKIKIAWYAVNNFFGEILFTVPSRSHLELVFLGTQKLFRGTPFLNFWMNRFSVNSQQFTIKYLNGFMLICRIAGKTGTGVNVVGLHVPIILLDESAYYPWGTWIELQQVLNDWEPGHQIMVSGVPDGRREKSVCYVCDTDPNFSHHNISAYRNPRFTKEREEQLIAQFGGKDSQDFIRQVLGEHGTPTYAVFDRELMRLEDYDVPVIKLYGKQLKDDSQLIYRVVYGLPGPPKYADHLIFGIDLGYTQPTSICVLYSVDDIWYFLFRLELQQISYDIQERLINILDDRYNPNYIGLDMGAGGQGKSIYHTFINDERYKGKDYVDRIVPVEFGGTVVVGLDEDSSELKERVKQFSVSKLQQVTNNHQIAYSSRDDDLLSELERVIYHRTDAGNVQYKVMTPGGSDRGDDHNFAALLTFVMILFERLEGNYIRVVKPKLFRPQWLTGRI